MNKSYLVEVAEEIDERKDFDEPITGSIILAHSEGGYILSIDGRINVTQAFEQLKEAANRLMAAFDETEEEDADGSAE